ncbi:MAG: peptidoglycan DD-metalloendopeptidase family protein [Vicinamibacterales bacterium]
MQDPRIASMMDIARQATAKAPAPDAASDRAKAAQLAEEFESMLLLQMLRQMRSSMLGDEDKEDNGLGLDTYTDTFDGELARTLSKAGGLGIKEFVMQGFERAGLAPEAPAPAGADGLGTVAVPAAVAGAAAPVVAAPGAPAATDVGISTPAVTGVPGNPGISSAPGGGTPHALERGSEQLVDGKVTSAFGMRRDPFHGQTTFHTGVDLRAAYGQQVPAVSEGRVAFAGEQGGYGLTVVVDHGGGLQTRYAHLSAIDVTAGQTLAAGQVLGRVGQTGRATAPHLHFEVSQGGQKVDPERAAERFAAAGLKLVALDVD